MFEISNIGILTAFIAGAISFLSPCVLPLVPGYISYVVGTTEAVGASNISRRKSLPALLLSGCFVLGFSTIFIALGAGATGLSHILLSYRYEANVIGGQLSFCSVCLPPSSFGSPGLRVKFASTAT